MRENILGGEMKKRVAVILLVICILPATLAAATPFFQFGPLVSYNKTVVELDDESAWKDINNFSFGADVRLNPIKWLSIDIPATIGFGSKGSFSIALLPTINANIPIYITDSIGLDIALGVGTQFDFQYVGEAKEWTMNGHLLENAGDAFAESKLVYRAGVTVNLAILSVGLNAAVPCKGTFSASNAGDIFNPMLESTRVSAVVLFGF